MSEVLACQVEILDGSTVSIDVNKRARAEYLFTEVFRHLGLEETDYFGLQFEDHKHVIHWVDPLKPIRKQMKRGPYNFVFRVKLYPVDPAYLFDDATKYFLSLQVKEDLLDQKLVCSEATRAKLFSYLVQGEYGDYDATEHGGTYLDELSYLDEFPPEFKQKILDQHKTNRGLLPAECDKKFLEMACRLERYGMDMHRVTDIASVNLWIGVTARGLTVYFGEWPHLLALNNFPWVRIAAVNFKNKSLMLEMVSLPGATHTEIIIFGCQTKVLCKDLWKSCVEHHSFFRSINTAQAKRPSSNSLFRRGSTFRYSGRTQYRLLQDGTMGGKKKTKFERISSRTRITRKTI
ncbi:hypothetical protein EMCRGX_G029375 [Ephydatia muelleri]